MEHKVSIFFGSNSKVGTTLTALCFAVKLKEKYRDSKVIFTGLNEGSSACYVNRGSEGIDNIALLLENGILESRFIEETSMLDSGIYYINEPENIVGAGSYRPETSRKMINFLKEKFDFVIVDAGSNINNGLTMGAITYDGEKVLYHVTTQSESSLAGYEKRMDFFQRMGIVRCKTILNKYDYKNPYDYKCVCKRFGLTDVDTFKISFGEDFEQCEREHRLPLKKNRNYNKEIEELVSRHTGKKEVESVKGGKILCRKLCNGKGALLL